MVGQVDGKTKKRRAAGALAFAAEARARFAERQIGRDVRVLFEQPLSGGRWLGHADNHVLVEVKALDGPLEGAIRLVRAELVDPAAPDRVVGRLLVVHEAPAAAAAG
jgi:tRNA A37 methylthiotransferase MiaB